MYAFRCGLTTRMPSVLIRGPSPSVMRAFYAPPRWCRHSRLETSRPVSSHAHHDENHNDVEVKKKRLHTHRQSCRHQGLLPVLRTLDCDDLTKKSKRIPHIISLQHMSMSTISHAQSQSQQDVEGINTQPRAPLLYSCDASFTLFRNHRRHLCNAQSQQRFVFGAVRNRTTRQGQGTTSNMPMQGIDEHDLNVAYQKDSDNLAIAARYGIAAIPLALLLDGAITMLFFDTDGDDDGDFALDEEYVAIGFMDIVAIVFSMHMGWSLTWFQCLRTLHRQSARGRGDPLATLANKWSKVYDMQIMQRQDEKEEHQQEQVAKANNEVRVEAKDGEGSQLHSYSSTEVNPATRETIAQTSMRIAGQAAGGRSNFENTTTNMTTISTSTDTGTSAASSIMLPREMEEARDRNYKRVYNSYHAGLYAPLSLLMAAVPFMPLLSSSDMMMDENSSLFGQEDLHFPTKVWEQDSDGGDGIAEQLTDYSIVDSILQGNPPDWMDYGIIGICVAGFYMCGKRAYGAWNMVQRNPPTELPWILYLRASAAGIEHKVNSASIRRQVSKARGSHTRT
jgi:hypothetical protein